MESLSWFVYAAFVASGVWMVTSAYGGWRVVLTPAKYDPSWRRLPAPIITTAIFGGLAEAAAGSAGRSLLAVLPLALLVAAAGVVVCSLSCLAIMATAKRQRDWVLKEQRRYSSASDAD
ncbi:MAG: hypothetical protein U1E29_02390 [Coriobacteriia bacterium]|nr:hypothetical protein [Coriobacteriia bacterium]